MIDAAQLIAAARSIIGVPYLHQGHTCFGVDCIGSFWLAAELAGLNIMDAMPLARGERAPEWNYSRGAQPLALLRMRRWADAVPAPVPGGLVFFCFPGAEHPQHFGIFTDTGTIIHALENYKRVVEHSLRRPWIGWVHSCWRVPGVRYG
jgi:cell wall-associated NlpC family hydrolase